MKKRRPNPRLVKIHRNYTVEEVAELFGAHKNTVRNWIRDGLPLLDYRRPQLILGVDLRTYLEEKRASKKRRCQLGELYCLRCRAPRNPAANMAEFQPVSAKVGNLLAICPECESIMNQRISMMKLEAFQAFLDVTFTRIPRHIVDTSKPILNCDFKLEVSNHAKAQR